MQERSQILLHESKTLSLTPSSAILNKDLSPKKIVPQKNAFYEFPTHSISVCPQELEAPDMALTSYPWP